MIGLWEQGKRPIGKDSRYLLLSMIRLLKKYDGIKTLEEALAKLGYSTSQAEEIVAYAVGHGTLGNAPGINGWARDKQNFMWVAPYHEGAIRYYKEAGVWSDEAQAHNDNLIARQAALMAAWKALEAEAPENWEEAWDAKRRSALEAGGFAVVF